MRQFSFTTSFVASHLRRAIGFAGDVFQPMLGWAGREIPPRRSLYARSWTEMAREEPSRSRIDQGHVSRAAIDPSNPAQLRSGLYDVAVESM
jgi:hypothetical protein